MSVIQHVQLVAAVIVLLLALPLIVHYTFLDPLGHIPGPRLAKYSSLFLNLICYLGIEGRVIRAYHQKYGRVIRVGRNSVSIADPEALRAIYVVQGGFPKDSRYRNFDLGPVQSIFSSTDTAYRDARAKAVAPLFAPASLRAESGPEGTIGSCITEFVTQIREYKEARVTVDLLDLCARLSIDVVTAYLLGDRYGGLREHAHLDLAARQKAKLSANPFIHAIVAFSRFSLLPSSVFRVVYGVFQRLATNDQAKQSFIQLDRFISGVMDSGETKSKSCRYYHARLISAGVSPGEASAQSKAIVFAGADSTAVMLTTILFHLVQNPLTQERLKAEINANQRDSHTLENMPFLRACVKEGLRLGMANPTRLTRVVPTDPGLVITTQNGKVLIPGGTVVGCAAYDLHHDPHVFPDPFRFCPERWLDDSRDGGLSRPGMEKSMMPFGHGLRACIGKNLAMHQLHQTIIAVGKSNLLEGAIACKDKIEMYEWFNGDIKGHEVNVRWR